MLVKTNHFVVCRSVLDLVVNLYLPVFKSQCSCRRPDIHSSKMATPVPEWDSAILLAHKLLNVTGHGHPFGQ